MSIVRVARESLVEVSRRFSRAAHEAEDLAHDLILSALRRGVALDREALVHGAARRHGAFLARSAGRRRARETRYATESVAASGAGTVGGHDDGTPASALSPALRTTLLLLLMELEKAELRVALGVSDAALRKRFQALRAHAPLARPNLRAPVRTPILNRVRRSQVDLLPRLAAARVASDRAGRVVATSDPDGHALIFAQVLTRSSPAATGGASATTDRVQSKENPCSTLRSRTSRSSSS